MATTAWRSAGTISSQTRTGGAVSWTNPSNAGASDNVYATAGLASNSTHWLWATNFGFSTSDVPSGATIVGLEVKWERKSAPGFANLEPSIHRTYYNPIKSSALHGTQKTVDGDLPSSDAYETQGGASDMWSGTWSDSDAIASTTGLAIAFADDHYTSLTVSADDIQIRWHYTTPSSNKDNMFLVF